MNCSHQCVKETNVIHRVNVCMFYIQSNNAYAHGTEGIDECTEGGEGWQWPMVNRVIVVQSFTLFVLLIQDLYTENAKLLTLNNYFIYFSSFILLFLLVLFYYAFCHYECCG